MWELISGYHTFAKFPWNQLISYSITLSRNFFPSQSEFLSIPHCKQQHRMYIVPQCSNYRNLLSQFLAKISWKQRFFTKERIVKVIFRQLHVWSNGYYISVIVFIEFIAINRADSSLHIVQKPKFRASKCMVDMIWICQLWFHVKTEWQKISVISTLQTNRRM